MRLVADGVLRGIQPSLPGSGFLQDVSSCSVHGVLEAARRVHDEHLSLGSYHLFRLPEEVEQDLHTSIQSSLGDDLASQAPQSRETALEALKRMAASGGTASVGPTAIGSIKDLDSTDTLQAIAAAYRLAFTQDVKTYPYLVP